MKINSTENHLVMSGKQRVITKINNNEDEPQKVEELFRTDMDSKLTFENHINKICKKTCQKFDVLARIS